METQQLMSYRLPIGADHDRIGDLKAASGFSTETIRSAAEQGKLLGFRANGKGAKGKEQRWNWSFPREASIAWLSSIAHFEPEDLEQQLVESLDKLPPDLLLNVISLACRRLDAHDLQLLEHMAAKAKARRTL